MIPCLFCYYHNLILLLSFDASYLIISQLYYSKIRMWINYLVWIFVFRWCIYTESFKMLIITGISKSNCIAINSSPIPDRYKFLTASFLSWDINKLPFISLAIFYSVHNVINRIAFVAIPWYMFSTDNTRRKWTKTWPTSPARVSIIHMYNY